MDWEKIAPHPSNILIAGDVGTGKTALAGTYVEYGKKKGCKLFSVGRDFPYCRNVDQSFTPPKNSIVLVDDAHLTGLYAHEHIGKTKKIYDFMQRQKRHRNHSIVYTTQDTTGFTLRLIRLLDAICLFQPSMMAIEYERPKIKTRYTKAKQALAPYAGKFGYVWIQHQDRKTHEIHEEVHQFKLPSFWSDDVSIPKSKKDLAIKPGVTSILKAVREVGRLFG
jgi:hypothetical protein